MNLTEKNCYFLCKNDKLYHKEVCSLSGDTKEIGKRIKLIRKELGLNQTEFAKEIGATASAVSNWEQGLNSPNNERFKAISDLSGKSIDYLIFGKMSEDDIKEIFLNTLDLYIENGVSDNQNKKMLLKHKQDILEFMFSDFYDGYILGDYGLDTEEKISTKILDIFMSDTLPEFLFETNTVLVEAKGKLFDTKIYLENILESSSPIFNRVNKKVIFEAYNALLGLSDYFDQLSDLDKKQKTFSPLEIAKMSYKKNTEIFREAYSYLTKNDIREFNNWRDKQNNN